MRANVFLNVIANYSKLATAQFWAQMQASNLIYPIGNGVAQPFDPSTGAPLQSALMGLTSDVCRGLEYSIPKNKNSTLFPSVANIIGAIDTSTPGLDKICRPSRRRRRWDFPIPDNLQLMPKATGSGPI